MKRNVIYLTLPVFLLAGCAEIFGPGFGLSTQKPGADTVRPLARPDGRSVVPSQNARTVEDFDTTTDAERTAALSTTPAGERELGRTIASLGNVAISGFWLETPLVSEPTKGRIVYPATGKSVAVDLIPIDGPATGGSRISLPAIRLLGAPLTSLPELIVYAG